MNRNKIVSILFLILLGASLPPFSASADETVERRGITVTGNGLVEAMPDTIELTAMVEGNAELAGDAMEKYRGHKRRVVDALNGLNLKGVTVAGTGLAFNSGTPVNAMAVLQAGQANAPKAADKVAVQERLTVSLADINKIEADKLLQTVTRIVDVIKDAGGIIGAAPKSMIEIQLSGSKPATLATFKLSNAEALRQQSYAAALKQARAKAEALAQLAGVELGEVISIRETAPVAKDTGSSNNMAAYFALIGGAASQQREFTSAELQSIPVAVSLSVQFDIVKKK